MLDLELIVHFFANFFYFFLPSFAFSSLQQPSFAFIGEGSERGFWRGFWPSRQDGLRRPEPTAASAVAWGYGGRVAGGEMDCAYVSHA
jgi:hypothetical protein